LAGGKSKAARKDANFGPPIEGGFRVPLGVCSIKWQGELPQ
jgi:hypothetical protein